MHRTLRAVATAAAIVLAPTAIAGEKDIAGDYAMKGKSLRSSGPGYAGDCTLKRNKEIYNVNCVNTGSGDKYVGKGIMRAGQFSLYLGEYLVVYNVGADGTLTGNWTHANSDDYGEEILTPKK